MKINEVIGKIRSEYKRNKTLIIGIDGAGGGVDVEVYAPVEWKNHARRDGVCERLEKQVSDAIEAGVKEEVTDHDSI